VVSVIIGFDNGFSGPGVILRRPASDELGTSHTFTLTKAHPAVKKRTHGVLCNRQRPEKGETIAVMGACPSSAQTRVDLGRSRLFNQLSFEAVDP